MHQGLPARCTPASEQRLSPEPANIKTKYFIKTHASALLKAADECADGTSRPVFCDGWSHQP
jgi:hypothetical protein